MSTTWTSGIWTYTTCDDLWSYEPSLACASIELIFSEGKVLAMKPPPEEPIAQEPIATAEQHRDIDILHTRVCFLAMGAGVRLADLPRIEDLIRLRRVSPPGAL